MATTANRRSIKSPLPNIQRLINWARHNTHGCPWLDDAARELERVKKVVLKKRKLAKLTGPENHEWCAQFETYITCCGYTPAQADKQAWIDVQGKYPRLRKFDGAKP